MTQGELEAMKIRSLLLPVLVALSVLAPAGVAQAAQTLQPGAYHESDDGSCTLNFVYTRGTDTLLGTAAHCVPAGVGTRVRDLDGVEFGTVSFMGDENVTEWDFAFIKVDPEDVGRVSPAVKGYPQYPKGFTTPGETRTGDVVQASGYGLGFGTTRPTQEQRKAILSYDDAELHTLTGPIIFGDSGGPFVHVRTGKALGIVSRLCIGVCSEEGPTVQGLLDKAASRGYAVTLRTV
jgi:hypothetical protein